MTTGTYMSTAGAMISRTTLDLRRTSSDASALVAPFHIADVLLVELGDLLLSIHCAHSLRLCCLRLSVLMAAIAIDCSLRWVSWGTKRRSCDLSTSSPTELRCVVSAPLQSLSATCCRAYHSSLGLCSFDWHAVNLCRILLLT